MLSGRYEVLEEIGNGATAITYRGRDQRLDRYVAIKIMRQDHDLDTSFVQRFEREARTAASVAHGNVVDVYDVGQEDGNLYIVMQYVDGEDLKHLIVREGALPVRRAREITRQVLAGLGAIHAAGIVHRDIKPQNVLIGRDGIARVTDFGIAQVAMDIGLTTAGTTVGTAAYMAPEQAQGGKLTEATDLYAVGVMLYEMLTGQMPFEAATPMAMMLAHIQQQPVPPSQRLGGEAIPPDLDGIVLQAMAKNPANRFRTASAMSRALDGVSTASSRTTVLPSARDGQRTRVIGDPARIGAAGAAAAGAWPQASRSITATVRPAELARTQAGTGLRGVLGGLLLLLLLAIAGVAGYLLYDMIADGNGAEGISATEENTAPPTQDDPTATATAAPTEDPSEETEVPIIAPAETDPPAEPTATSEPTETPTQEPTTAPTEIPTAVPTAVPTSVPTAVPTALPTAVPTAAAEPDDGSDQIILPVDAQDGSDNGEDEEDEGDENVIKPIPGTSGNGPQLADDDPAQIQQVSASQGDGAAPTGQATTLGIESRGWKGDGSKHDKAEDWVVVAPGRSATADFDLEALPASESFVIEISLAVTGSGQVPLTVLLNGQELDSFEGTLPVLPEGGSAGQLGTLRITLPTAPLEEGRNEITIVNGAVAGESDDDDDDGDESEDDDPGSSENRGRGNADDSSMPDNTLLLSTSVITFTVPD
jgi:serine/threonine-protein kinase